MKNTSRFKYIGIDPGASGGIAVIDEKGIMMAYKCPKSSDEMSLLFQMCMGSTPAANIKLLMERVWARPTNAVRAAFSYGVNYGQWLGIVATHEVEMNTAIPVEWIKWVGCPKALKRDVRKRWLKEKAGELYPNVNKLTLATSDAILITHFAKEEFFNGEK
tara:strand:- start:748 stop:1230 length:483 start_codon:yes stop_codon:yes gene_type:complete